MIENVFKLAVFNKEWKRKRLIEMLIVIKKSCVIPQREIASHCSPSAFTLH